MEVITASSMLRYTVHTHVDVLFNQGQAVCGISSMASASFHIHSLQQYLEADQNQAGLRTCWTIYENQ